MKKTSYYLIIAILLLSISLTACERNLPPPTKTTAPKATAQDADLLETINQIATQTAQALAQPIPATPGPEQPTQAPVALPTEPIAVLPTAAPVMAMPTPVMVVPATYTLQKDEFPYCIARRFDVNPYELLSRNGLSSGNLFSPGLTLVIPQPHNPFPDGRALRPHPATYTVLGGESIYKIACLYGDVDPLAIAAVNALQPPYNLAAGQVLSIP